jgi:uncharacterized repeat protein (TIGR03803 family)
MKSTKSAQSNLIEQPPRRRICTSWIVPLLLLWMLPAGLSLMMAGRVSAQTFTTLYSFTGGPGYWPQTGLILSGNTLYGTAWNGGGCSFCSGEIVFALNTDGKGFTDLFDFRGQASGLILSSNTLYGLEEYGVDNPGPSQFEVFALSTDGTAVTNLEVASGVPNPMPAGRLILSDNILYGTTAIGGSSGNGTILAVNTDFTGLTNLYSFTANPYGTNSDGAEPQAGLILSGNTLYGTASAGGSSGNGTVFAVNTDGTGFTNLHTFTEGSDGTGPQAGLILSGNTLYGTAQYGGSSGNGTIFAVNTDGTGFRNLHSFPASVLVNDTNSPSYSFSTNSDGANPAAGLVLSGDTLYGTAEFGGTNGNGTVFAVNTDGTGFTVLHGFTTLPCAPGDFGCTNSDGANPVAGLLLSGNTLYGTATWGGTGSGWGTVFSIFIQPQLTLIPCGPYIILTWPTNYSGFTLQSTTNLGSSAVWTTNSAPPVVIGGENVVINAASGKQQFYRLSYGAQPN